MNHCIATIVDLIERGRDNRRSVLQLGYNLGRLSELTGLGREPFWDCWKVAVEEWDLARLRDLARELPSYLPIPAPQVSEVSAENCIPDHDAE